MNWAKLSCGFWGYLFLSLSIIFTLNDPAHADYKNFLLLFSGCGFLAVRDGLPHV
jgi:hypothetical protein